MRCEQMTDKTKLLRVASQVTPQRHQFCGVQRCGPTRTHSLAQAGQSMGFKPRHPALHRSAIYPKKFGDLLAALAASDHQKTVQSMVVPRLIKPRNVLLDPQAHEVGISNFEFSHDPASHQETVISITQPCGNI